MIIMESLYQMGIKEGLDIYRAFFLRAVDYAISLDDQGHFIGVIPLQPAKNGKHKPKPIYMECPRDKDRSNDVLAYPLCDKRIYIFHDFDKDAAKGAEKRLAFRQKLQMIHDATKDKAVKAVLLYLDRLDRGQETCPEDRFGDKFNKSSWITFHYGPDDEYVMYRDAVRQFWTNHFVHDDVPGNHQCCVTGEMIKKVQDNYPKVLGIPGAHGGGTPIVSVNDDKHSFESFGLDGVENYPYSRKTIEVASLAMERLCRNDFPAPGSCYPKPTHAGGMPTRSIYLDKATLFCFWSDSDGGLALADHLGPILDADPDALKDQTWNRMWKGMMPSQPGDIGHHDCEYIYGMIFVGADRPQFNATTTYPVLKLQQNLVNHFLDINVSRISPNKKTNRPNVLGLRRLLQSCAQIKDGKTQDPPSKILIGYLWAILHGKPYPNAVAAMAEARYSLEFHNAKRGQRPYLHWEQMDGCASIIKGHLNRQIRLGKTPDTKEFTEHMDHTRTDPAYALGCALAIANALQAVSHGREPNSGIAEELFVSCKSTPMAGYERLGEKVLHFTANINRLEKKERRKSWGLYLQRAWSFWQSNINGNMPQKFDLAQRMAFTLGFHQAYAWINNKSLRDKWMTQDGIPDILKPSQEGAKNDNKLEREEDILLD